jgi:DUF438 domain-containing protein
VKINGHSKIDELLTRYPYLEDYLPTLCDQYKPLRNKLVRKTVGKFADIDKVAAIGGFEVAVLLEKIGAKIREQSGDDVLESPVNKSDITEQTDRLDAIKAIIKKLHEGTEPDSLKAEFSALLQNIGAHELAQAEQALIDGGMPVAEVQRMCNLHSSIFSDGLKSQSIPGVPAGHPVQIMLKENRELERRIATILEDASASDMKARLADLKTIDLHYVRKENQLFPLLERHEITGPSRVMWGKHDEIRELFKKAEAEDPASEPTLQALTLEITEMITKEEKILIPMALEVLSDAEWKEVSDGARGLGYCWITPDEVWVPVTGTSDARPDQAAGGDIDLDVGHMSPDLLNLMMRHLPIEMSLVNENDEVVYYSQTKERIFPRTPAVIGRKVQNCHPPSSIDTVNRILAAFKNGEKDVAEFWLEMKGMFINIRYFAVRDDKNVYRGCLEVTQDVSHIRSLDGERRLLDWT